MISYTRKVFDAPASNKNNRVLLKIVLLTWNITYYFVSISKPDFGNFPHRRVRFFRRCGIYSSTHPPFLRALLQVLWLGPFNFWLPWFADQLLYRWHSGYPVFSQILVARHEPYCLDLHRTSTIQKTAIIYQRIDRRGGSVEDQSSGSDHTPSN